MGTIGYLLDTHTFLWAVQKQILLSDAAKRICSNAQTLKFVSAVSAYEIMYKYKIGKLPEYSDVANDYFGFIKRLGVYELPISSRHAHFAGKFDWSHRDPFDRLLAAQASVENLTIITNDTAFDTLPWVKVVW